MSDIAGQVDLQRIASEIRREFGLGNAKSSEALHHYLNAGELLCRARPHVPSGQFMSWVEEQTGVTYYTAATYMRLSKCRDMIPADITTRQEANWHIAAVSRGQTVEQAREHARKKREKKRLRSRQFHEERELKIARAERDKKAAAAAKAAGGPLAEAYSLVRRACQQVDHARARGDLGRRRALDQALTALLEADDQITRALGFAENERAA